MDIIPLLFDDVKRIPIITSAAQELWLGIQVKAPQVWTEYESWAASALPSAIYSELNTRLSGASSTDRHQGASLPSFDLLPSETWAARKDIHALGRSYLRHIVRAANALKDEETKRCTVAQVYEAAELLSLLPDSALLYVVKALRETADWPTPDEFQAWSAKQPAEPVWEQAVRRATRARTILVEGYLRYVLRVAGGSIGRGLEYPDLVQEGVFGLMRAAERFDYRAGARFGQFAANWIRQAIGRALADQGRTIRLPVHMYEQVQAIRRSIEEAATEDDLLTSLLRQKRVCRLLEFCQPIVPLHLELSTPEIDQLGLEDGPDEPVTLADCLVDNSRAVQLEYRQQGFQRLVQEMLVQIGADLHPRNLKILQQRSGLLDGQERSLEEVGQIHGLTRERIRQIEQRAHEKLRYLGHKWLKDIIFVEPSETPKLPRQIQRYLEDRFNPLYSMPAPGLERERHRLDRLLQSLPAGDLYGGRPATESSRSQQLEMALRSLANPAHYTTITDQLNDMIADPELDASSVYGLLKRHDTVFASLGEGVFSLVEWERWPGVEDERVLPYCPALLPDPPDQPDSFLESVVQARKILENGRSVDVFLQMMTEWAGLGWPQPATVCQSVLSAYFLVGVIPYVYYSDHQHNRLSLVLPMSNLQQLRVYCLDTLSRRLQAMPEFWWLLQRRQPIRVTELALHFVSLHPFALDDTVNRLNLLAGIGAVQRSPNGRYRLTALGESVAERWAQEPGVEFAPLESKHVDDVWDFAELLLE